MKPAVSPLEGEAAVIENPPAFFVLVLHNKVDVFSDVKALEHRLERLAILASFVTLLVLACMGYFCLLYTSPSPRDRTRSRMPSSA